MIVRPAVTGQDSSRVLKPAHRSIMPQINMIPHPVTLTSPTAGTGLFLVLQGKYTSCMM